MRKALRAARDSVATCAVMLVGLAGSLHGQTPPPLPEAQRAGMFEAFRTCLKQQKAAGRIAAEEYQRCDLTADRMYFSAYNTYYARVRSIPQATRFVNEAQQVVNDVAAHPERCHSDAFDEIATAVVNSIKATYPTHPVVGCGVVPVPCWCAAPNLTDNLTPTGNLHAALAIPHMTVYPDYCKGVTVDGILFLPQSDNTPPPQNSPDYQLYIREPHCDAANVHIRQFIYARCVAGYDCGAHRGSMCVTRNFNVWYLDECPPTPQNPTPEQDLTPDQVLSGHHEINDEPTPNLIGMKGAPLVEDFIDIMMCRQGAPQTSNEVETVLGAFKWTRTGVKLPEKPQWCTRTDSSGNVTFHVTNAPPYSDVEAVDPKFDPLVRQAVCSALNGMNIQNDKGLQSIVANLGGCPATP